MPTTLSACVALTTASGGNAAVALLLTVTTNMLGVRRLACGLLKGGRVQRSAAQEGKGQHLLLLPASGGETCCAWAAPTRVLELALSCFTRS